MTDAGSRARPDETGSLAPPHPSSPARHTFPRDLLRAAPLDAARELLGAFILRAGERGAATRVGRIVEVEAYGDAGDAASHARFGPTPRNRVMFGPPGIAYIYLVYGVHQCLNVVAGPPGRAGAVLIRAVEPVDGIEAMRADLAGGPGGHNRAVGVPRSVADTRLAAGPGLVGRAFGVDRSMTGLDLCDPAAPLGLLAPARPFASGTAEVIATPRIGVGYAAEPWASISWRLLLVGSASVSGPRTRLATRVGTPGR